MHPAQHAHVCHRGISGRVLHELDLKRQAAGGLHPPWGASGQSCHVALRRDEILCASLPLVPSVAAVSPALHLTDSKSIMAGLKVRFCTPPKTSSVLRTPIVALASLHRFVALLSKRSQLCRAPHYCVTRHSGRGRQHPADASVHGKCLLQMLFPPLLNPWCMQRQLAVRRCPLASPPRTIAAERPVETADQRTANGASAQAQVRRTCGRLPELSLAEDPCSVGL